MLAMRTWYPCVGPYRNHRFRFYYRDSRKKNQIYSSDRLIRNVHASYFNETERLLRFRQRKPRPIHLLILMTRENVFNLIDILFWVTHMTLNLCRWKASKPFSISSHIVCLSRSCCNSLASIVDSRPKYAMVSTAPGITPDSTVDL